LRDIAGSRRLIIDAQGGVHEVSVDHTGGGAAVQGVLALSRT
jgi:hypothetical protein